jgi:hypothetical protein
MSIDEAFLILNVKKEDPMEIIQKVSGCLYLPCLPPLISPVSYLPSPFSLAPIPIMFSVTHSPCKALPPPGPLLIHLLDLNSTDTQNYDAIFTANGPKEPPTSATPANRQTETKTTGPKRKPPSHSHYLQSKVYRALERIKAERGEAGSAATEPTRDPAVVAAEALGEAGAKVAEGAKGEKTI